MPRAAPSTSPSDPATLKSLLTSIPPKTLHTYTLAHLDAAPAPTLAALSAFFATLAPPPRLHCVRCHQDFIEVENTAHSCQIAHDDESANVEWVGNRGGEEYETTWGCCGRTVPGEGDMGPPRGWCFEGKHTTDVERARFRADADYTDEEDTHVSCLELNCHGRAKPKAKAGSKGKGKGKTKANDSGAEDGESVGGRARGVKSVATPKRKEAADGGKARKKRKVVESA